MTISSFRKIVMYREMRHKLEQILTQTSDAVTWIITPWYG
jgi:hypothetical protein